MRRSVSSKLMIAFLVLIAGSLPAFADSPLFSQGAGFEGIPAGGPYVPPGDLYDNEQSDGTTSLASQDSTGTLTARSADDFLIPTTIGEDTCDSGVYAVDQIRFQMVQADAAAQPFAIDIYNDNGAGTAPTPAGAVTPIATFNQTSSTLLGAFGIGTSIWEVVADTPGLELNAETIYWISGYGTNAALNASAFNNFFAASAGATGTTDNGVIIAPGAGVAVWTPVEQVIGPPPLAFSFAIDADEEAGPNGCIGGGGGGSFDPAVPTLSPMGIGIMAGLLALLSLVVIARRR